LAEIVFEHPGFFLNFEPSVDIRWLSAEDYDVFTEHLRLCGQQGIDRTVWQEICDDETTYCLLFSDKMPVARACVERYSQARWEVADVRVAREYRNRGYARAVCAFALQSIISNGRIATIRTEEDNTLMLRVINRLGFVLQNNIER